MYYSVLAVLVILPLFVQLTHTRESTGQGKTLHVNIVNEIKIVINPTVLNLEIHPVHVLISIAQQNSSKHKFGLTAICGMWSISIAIIVIMNNNNILPYMYQE